VFGSAQDSELETDLMPRTAETVSIS
jgi:hypothetical protein